MKKKNEASPTAKRYVTEVSERLICPKGTKKFFVRQFEDMVCSYAAEHPDASYDNLLGEFGEPEKISTEIVEKEEYREMLKKAKKKTTIWIIVAAIAVVISALLIGLIVYLIKEYGGEVVVSPVYIDSVVNSVRIWRALL